jgi:hypothetical protein
MLLAESPLRSNREFVLLASFFNISVPALAEEIDAASYISEALFPNRVLKGIRYCQYIFYCICPSYCLVMIKNK